MILRKPYALLIKNFKKIHLVLFLLMAYLIYESSNILKFFNDLISAGTFTRTSFSLSSTYLNVYMYLSAILVAVTAFAIYILMRQKKKPTLLYLIIIGFYLGLIIYFLSLNNIFETLEISSMSPRDIRIIRDIASVFCYAQYIIAFIIAIRAVGFNIKKFNFGEDLAELEIDVSDNEEFELTIGLDRVKLGRRFRRGRREIKYFIIENLFVISLLSFIVVISLVVTITLNVQVYSKVYNEGEGFSVNYFVNVVEDSYYTHLNQRGMEIAPEGKAYIVTKIVFNNKDTYPHGLYLDDIVLMSGNNVFSPIISRYQSFLDLGEGYIKQTINENETKTFILVFEVDEDIDVNDLILRYRESISFKVASIEATYKNIKLDVEKVDKIKRVNSASIGENLSFAESDLNNTSLKINDVQVEENFVYDATSCYADICNTNPTVLTLIYEGSNRYLMKLSFEYNKDAEVVFNNADNLAEMIDIYGLIRYTINNKTSSTILMNKTPSNYNGKDLYYQVPSILKEASSVDLVIRIRDKEFVYHLK